MIEEELNNLSKEQLIDRLKRIVGGGIASNLIGNEYNITDLEEDKFFGLNWTGKNYANQLASYKTETFLAPDKNHNDKYKNAKNILMVGDNLDSLKHLKEAYTGKIKMIYIDPPYNTGGDDFVYNDKFQWTDEEYREKLGLNADEIKRLRNLEGKSSHSAWLTFMYPRLKIAKELLTEDGVIFISIDDNEQAELKMLCDGVFGEGNFIEQFVWKKRKTQANLTKYIASSHEYIIFYAKNKENIEINKIPLREEYVKNMYKNLDNDPRGLWRTKPLASPDNAPNREFELDLRNGRKIKAKWRVSQETYDKWLENNLIVIPSNGKGMPTAKVFLKDNEGQIQNSLLIDIATNEEGSKEIENLFGSNAVFSNPKPVELIKHLLKLATDKSSIILDFFAGSGTTGQAVMELNAEDGGNRQFILCQLDEKIDSKKQAYKFCKENNLESIISNITIERLKRAKNKILNEHPESHVQSLLIIILF